jgi:hypothetical protein
MPWTDVTYEVLAFSFPRITRFNEADTYQYCQGNSPTRFQLEERAVAGGENQFILVVF